MKCLRENDYKETHLKELNNWKQNTSMALIRSKISSESMNLPLNFRPSASSIFIVKMFAGSSGGGSIWPIQTHFSPIQA